MQQVQSVVHRIKTWGFVAVVATVTAIQPTYAEAPAALSKAPQGAQFILIVPSMSELSGKMSMLNQTLGLDQPEMTDALGAFKAEVGIGDGMNDAGSALLVIQDLATAIETNEEPDILMILPVTDYPTFISSFQAEGAEPAGDGVTEITMPDGQSGFARESGGYAIMGNTEPAVTNYVPSGDAEAIGGRVGVLGLDYLGSSDMALYLDIEAMAPMLAPKIDEAIAEVMTELEQMAEMGMADAASLDMMKAAMTLYATAGKAIVESSEGFVFAVDISEHGIGFTDAIQFKPDSKVMKFLPGSEGNTSSILARLPKNSYIAAAAIDADAIAGTELLEAALAAMPQDNPQVDIYRKALPMMDQIQQYAAAFYTPDPAALMGGTGALNILASYKVKDGPAYVKATKEYITSLNGVTLPLAVPMADGGEPPVMTYVTSYTDNALQLDGVQVDQYSLQMQMPPEMMAQMGPAAGFMQMFTNFTGYAAESDGHYLATTTLDQQLMAKGLETGKTGDGIGTGDTLAEVREKAVPEGAVAEMYLSLGGIVETVGPMAMMFGLPAIEAPQDLPPLALGVGLKGNSAAARFYVPNETIKFVMDTVADVQAQMMGGQGGPDGQQPGQGAPPPPF